MDVGFKDIIQAIEDFLLQSMPARYVTMLLLIFNFKLGNMTKALADAFSMLWSMINIRIFSKEIYDKDGKCIRYYC